MDITDEILARLQNGEKVEDIAADLTNSINAANEQYEITKRRKEDNLRTDKRNAIRHCLDALCYLVETWDLGEDLAQELEDVTDETINELVDTLDQAIPFITKYIDLQKELHTYLQPKKVEVCDCAECHAAEAKIDPIESFLNTFVR